MDRTLTAVQLAELALPEPGSADFGIVGRIYEKFVSSLYLSEEGDAIHTRLLVNHPIFVAALACEDVQSVKDEIAQYGDFANDTDDGDEGTGDDDEDDDADPDLNELRSKLEFMESKAFADLTSGITLDPLASIEAWWAFGPGNNYWERIDVSAVSERWAIVLYERDPGLDEEGERPGGTRVLGYASTARLAQGVARLIHENISGGKSCPSSVDAPFPGHETELIRVCWGEDAWSAEELLSLSDAELRRAYEANSENLEKYESEEDDDQNGAEESA